VQNKSRVRFPQNTPAVSFITPLQASKAPQRCWDEYRQCCITGRGPLLNNDYIKPPDINSCHIFPHAYLDRVSKYSKCLSPELIPV
jgi:hypothetical protein